MARLSGGDARAVNLTPSARSRSPLAEEDQRIGAVGFMDASADPAPVVVRAEAEQRAPRAPELDRRPPSPVALRFDAPAPPATRGVPEGLESVALEALRTASTPLRTRETLPLPRGPRTLDEIVHSVARQNAERTRSRDAGAVEPSETESEREQRVAPPRRTTALVPVVPPPLAEDGALRVTPRGPTLEIGSIHVEVVREAPRREPPRGAVKARPAAPSRPQTGSPSLRSKLRFGLRQL